MTYQVAYSKKAIRQLDKLDPPTAALIYGWIGKNLIDTDDPRRRGKPLKGDQQRLWRYRVSDYRIIVEIDDGIVTVMVLTVGKRSHIYKEMRR